MNRGKFVLFLSIGLAIFLCLPFMNVTLRATANITPIIPDHYKQLWSADFIEGGTALALWRCCERSIRHGDVLIGKSGYLFLGNDHDNVIGQITGAQRPSQIDIKNWTENVSKLAAYSEGLGASFVFVLAPNKHTIYSEFLPKDIELASESITDRVLASDGFQDLSVVDLRTSLKKLKTDLQVYFLTDTHWNNAGAALAYFEILKALPQTNGQSIKPLKFELTEHPHRAGDLANFLKIGGILPEDHETDFMFNYEIQTTCMGTISLHSGTVTPCVSGGNAAIDVPSRDAFLRVSRTSTAQNKETVLMLCDSFCATHSELFNASFQTVYRIHWSQMSGERLKETLQQLRPDLVIYQSVERALLQHDFFSN